MRRDWTGEPPGLLTDTATAGACLSENAFSRAAAGLRSDGVGRKPVPVAMMEPCSRTTGIVTIFRRKPLGKKRFSMCLKEGSPDDGLTVNVGDRRTSAMSPR